MLATLQDRKGKTSCLSARDLYLAVNERVGIFGFRKPPSRTIGCDAVKRLISALDEAHARIQQTID